MADPPESAVASAPDTAGNGSGPDGPRPALPPPVLLERFSRSVRGAVERVIGSPPLADPISAWRIAEALLAAHSDYGAPGPPPNSDREEGARPPAQWLALAAAAIDRAALGEHGEDVIDGRLFLLVLGRLDDGFDRWLRETRFGRRLERDMGFGFADVCRPWAARRRRSELSLLWETKGKSKIALTLPFGQPAPSGFSRDGSLHLAICDDGSARVRDVVSGADRLVVDGANKDAFTCGFSFDESLIVTATAAGTVRIWDAGSGAVQYVQTHAGFTRFAWSPTVNEFVTFGDDGEVRLWKPGPQGLTTTSLLRHDGPARCAAYSQDGNLIATAGDDGTVRIVDLVAGEERAVLRGEGHGFGFCCFSPDGSLLAATESGGATSPDGSPQAQAEGRLATRIWETATLNERPALSGEALICAFSPDGTTLASVAPDAASLWDVELGVERAWLVSRAGGLCWCGFSPDGATLATAAGDGSIRLWDVASGEPQSDLPGDPLHPQLTQGEFSPDGATLAATNPDGTTRLWEEVEAPSLLPAVIPDSAHGVDRLDIAPDASALANLIAARGTEPPLSIGLFGDWGSGKSFLIGAVQDRIQAICRRARRSRSGSAYCGYVRNVEFNAWQYADANLWASLVAHIFDELAKPEPAAGVDDAETAQAQLARLEDELASKSALRQELTHARLKIQQAEARKRLLRWTWNLAGAGDEQSLEALGDDLQSTRRAAGLLLPTARARLVVVAVAVLAFVAVGAVCLVLGADTIVRVVTGAIAAAAVPLAWLAIGRRTVVRLLRGAGQAARIADVRETPVDAELEAARSAQERLERELADLRSGRGLARFVAERGASDDYRSQLGLVSRIHRDFDRMSEILATQSKRRTSPGDDSPDDVPPIDRIVLYIDDLDRCPPKRVVEVLEAVHLILALPLFVVVIAVDPRWLISSLRLHYSELLAGESDGAAAAAEPVADDDPEWRSTPLNYLEKIIQVPFALRPMRPTGVRALVHGLLPIERPVAGAESGDGSPGGTGAVDPSGAPPPGRPEPASAGTEAAEGPVRPSRPPSLAPRTLALSVAERDFAAEVAASLRTPRTVKKFTNLYRLLRAGLDDAAGDLDRFLDAEGSDAPEYRAVLILLGMVIAHPEQAPDALLELGDLSGESGEDRPWADYVGDLEANPDLVEAAAFLKTTAAIRLERHPASAAATWTTAPFRAWGLEVSRYSFATGQEVFAAVQTRIGS